MLKVITFTKSDDPAGLFKPRLVIEVNYLVFERNKLDKIKANKVYTRILGCQPKFDR